MVGKILIVHPTGIGDTLKITPIARELRKKYPKAHISYLIESGPSALLLNNPHLNEIIIFDRNAYKKELLIKEGDFHQVFSEIYLNMKNIQERKIDLTINLFSSYYGAILAYLSKAKKIFGFQMNSYGQFFGEIEPSLRPLHLINQFGRIAKIKPESKDLVLRLTQDEEKFGQSFLEDHKISQNDFLIGLNAGAAWPSKRWGFKNFVVLCDELISSFGAKVVLFGGTQDRKRTDRIKELMNAKPIVPPLLNLRELASVISRCKLFIGQDTGPLYMADALGIPNISIWGPTDPVYLGPASRLALCLQADIPCANCNKDQCQELNCMKEIKAEHVLEAVKIKRILDHPLFGKSEMARPKVKQILKDPKMKKVRVFLGGKKLS